MKTTALDPRIDRLYTLLPAIHRLRDARPADAQQRLALQALLRVIAEQVDVVEDDIRQLYENWFIETADDWVVPYLGDLIGYRPVIEADGTGNDSNAEDGARRAVLAPRREVANTLRYRRRKGALALLEQLANDAAGWPARAVEFFRLLGWTQNLNHLHPERARTTDLRDLARLERLGGAFDTLARTVDIRRIHSHRTRGRHNVPSVGVFVWRLRPCSVTHAPAYCREDVGGNCYTFSALGLDTQLFTRPVPETDETSIAAELNVPAPISRRAFTRGAGTPGPLGRPEASGDFYGEDKSLAIWAPGWCGCDGQTPVPAGRIEPADLTDWTFQAAPGTIAVDPVLGRFCLHPCESDGLIQHVRVSYHEAFSADVGGGEYAREILEPSNRGGSDSAEPAIYRIDPGAAPEALRLTLEKWRSDARRTAVIELTDSGVYFGPGKISLPAGSTLQIRAVSGARPLIRLPDRRIDQPDAFSVEMAETSRLVLDGLLITGRPLHISGPVRRRPVPDRPAAGPNASVPARNRDIEPPSAPARETTPENPPANPDVAETRAPVCGSSVVLRHCTLVPAWSEVPNWDLHARGRGSFHVPPSLELHDVRARVRIEHSILGAIQVHEDEVRLDPIPLSITDSILDATGPGRLAVGTLDGRPAHVLLTIRRCTVFGITEVHEVELAENSIFTHCLNVARRQLGCMRFCYVPHGCRTPRRYHCQPDFAAQRREEQLKAEADAAGHSQPGPEELAAAKALERERVVPQFTRVDYGAAAYAQLADGCAAEIRAGADDESEMGVFHDLFQPQRETILQTRLEEYTPAGFDVGVLHAT